MHDQILSITGECPNKIFQNSKTSTMSDRGKQSLFVFYFTVVNIFKGRCSNQHEIIQLTTKFNEINQKKYQLILNFIKTVYVLFP